MCCYVLGSELGIGGTIVSKAYPNPHSHRTHSQKLGKVISKVGHTVRNYFGIGRGLGMPGAWVGLQY